MTSAVLIASTRKGLFVLERSASGWDVTNTAFVGDNVSIALPDRRGPAPEARSHYEEIEAPD